MKVIRKEIKEYLTRQNNKGYRLSRPLTIHASIKRGYYVTYNGSRLYLDEFVSFGGPWGPCIDDVTFEGVLDAGYATHGVQDTGYFSSNEIFTDYETAYIATSWC